ncbi:hypothetical protein MHYP_G00214610 [Metynnis hypsauchen]
MSDRQTAGSLYKQILPNTSVANLQNGRDSIFYLMDISHEQGPEEEHRARNDLAEAMFNHAIKKNHKQKTKWTVFNFLVQVHFCSKDDKNGVQSEKVHLTSGCSEGTICVVRGVECIQMSIGEWDGRGQQGYPHLINSDSMVDNEVGLADVAERQRQGQSSMMNTLGLLSRLVNPLAPLPELMK